MNGPTMTSRKTTLASILAAILLTVAAAARVRADAAAWTISADNITDNRTANLAAGSEPAPANTASITLNVHGPAANSVGSWGKVVITRATDDAGENLLPQRDAFFGSDPNQMTSIDEFARKMMQDDPSRGIPVQLQFASPKRSAKQLVSVEGHFDLQLGGAEQIVTVPNLPSLSGKPVTDPLLKTAGITATVTEASAGGDALGMQLSGAVSSVKDVAVLDASGENLVIGHGWSEINGVRDARYHLKSPLNPNCKLQIKLVTGQKSQTVPFHLKNIPLP
jgi:hypothetical protein